MKSERGDGKKETGDRKKNRRRENGEGKMVTGRKETFMIYERMVIGA